MINKKGLAQIPLMIVLLIVAVAIPIATRLVQQNQDNRNLAVHTCGNVGSYCDSNQLCCGGNTCTMNECYLMPTATPTNDPRQPCGSWRSDECSTGSCTGGNVCINNHSIGSKCVCIAPTVTPPSSSCYKDYSICINNSQCCSGDCQGICRPIPTATPTKKSCYSDYSICINNSQCCSGDCQGVCRPIPTATPTKIPGGPIVPPIVTNPPVDDSMCPEAEACPHSETDLLRNCTPADADGTSKDTRCYADTVGTRGQCGGKEYCCPSAGGSWTLDMTNCPTPINPPTTCTQCAGNPDAKLKGDADCSGSTNINDASIWRDEFNNEGGLGTVSRNTWNADFDCDGKVTINDISIWRANFINGLPNN